MLKYVPFNLIKCIPIFGLSFVLLFSILQLNLYVVLVISFISYLLDIIYQSNMDYLNNQYSEMDKELKEIQNDLKKMREKLETKS